MLYHQIQQCNIDLCYISDHSSITMNYVFQKQAKILKNWYFNVSLLNDKEYDTTNAGRDLSIFCLHSETSNGEIFEWE